MRERGRVLHYLLHALRSGAIRTLPVVEASSLVDEQVLDVRGRRRVIHMPGHTTGNAAMLLEDREALIVGGALATIDLVSQVGAAPASAFNERRS